MNLMRGLRYIKSNLEILSGINKSKFESNNKKRIFYMLLPIHGNLGDQAIAYATCKFIRDKWGEFEIIEINSEDIYKKYISLKGSIRKEDLIVLHGGGNLGTHYIKEEEKRRFIIDKFKNNNIISFTQTMYFSPDNLGELELNRSKKIYNSHKNLTILARENKSFNMMKKEFYNCNIIKCPDIVFYLKDKILDDKKERDQITTLFRKDKETFLSNDIKENFICNLKNVYSNVKVSDTYIDKKITKKNREDELYKLWREIQKSKFVVTDRLHGLIFCVINNTPCIVIRSLDHKVIETYEWVKDLKNVILLDELDIDKIEKIASEFSSDKKDKYKLDFESKYFNNIYIKKCDCNGI